MNNCATLRRVIPLSLLCTVLCSTNAAGSSNTPPDGHTGAPGHLTCTQCHNPFPGNGNVALNFSGGSQYQPGQNQSLTVTVSDAAKARWGFSMVARDTSNNTVNVGTWSAGSSDTQVHDGNHIGHKDAPRVGGGSHTFTVNWKAPNTGVGDVTFYVAANAANGNNNFNGDTIYTSQLTISQQVPPNQAPELTVPAGMVEATAEIATPITGVSLSDPDAGSGNMTVTLSVGNGALTVADAVAGGVGAGDITSNGSAGVTVDGTLAQINATFGDPNGIVYESDPEHVGDETLQLSVDDNGNTGSGGSQTDNASIAITVVQQPNQAPGFSVPAGTFNVTQQTATSIIGVSISDADAGAGNITVTLTAANGVVSVADSVPGGVTAGGIADNDSASVTINGTLAEINATLGAPAGLTYQSEPGHLGDDTIDLLVNDNGNTGSGGSQMDSASIPISVFPPPGLSNMVVLGDGSVEYTLTGTPGRTYSVNRSDDLQTWILLEQVTLQTTMTTVTDPGAANSLRRFYQAIEN